MIQEIKVKWVSIMRLNKHNHGRGSLRSKDDKFCPLGMLCEIAFAEGVIERPYYDEDADGYIYGGNGPDSSSGVLPKSVMKWAGLEEADPEVVIDGKQTTIVCANDISRVSLTKIINAIERQL